MSNGNLKLRWKLDRIFKGGSRSKPFHIFIKALQQTISKLEKSSNLKATVDFWQQSCKGLTQAESFVHCLLAQDVNDKKAEELQGIVSELKAQFEVASNTLDKMLKQHSHQEFEKILKNPFYQPIAFSLREKRRSALEKLEAEQEALISDLSVDGYHGWSQLYGTLIGQVVIPLKIKGRVQEFSWGQAYNKLSHPERAVRKAVFENSNAVWKKYQHVYAHTLNHIAGFRLKMYSHRKWPFLKEPLEQNRMDEETLDTMWRVIAKNKKPFCRYLKCKAKLLGRDKLCWYDLDAPVASGKRQKEIPYQEGSDFIISCFAKNSPKMAAFAKKAMAQAWIEAEDRKGKRPGGFSTDFPVNKESRIFMTYSGTNESLFTLAHELGHAFHSHVMFDLPELARRYPMNLAETASTFAEMLVSEAALAKESNRQRKLALLDDRLQRSIIFLFNIHSRFLFETSFYQERQKGIVSADRLCELMTQAQKEGYCGSLAEYHPYFWVSKMHFNLTDVPFYNFPYTFGYLFSLGIYLHAKEASNFEESYVALLRDTGSLAVEDLAKKHLGADLRQEAFWQKAIDYLKNDVEMFVQT